MKKKDKTQFKIIKLGGRSRRVEVGFSDTIGSLVGGFMAIAVATIAMDIMAGSLKKSGLLNPVSQSKISGRTREAARV